MGLCRPWEGVVGLGLVLQGRRPRGFCSPASPFLSSWLCGGYHTKIATALKHLLLGRVFLLPQHTPFLLPIPQACSPLPVRDRKAT